MDRFFGFDLGDAESAISRIQRQGQAQNQGHAQNQSQVQNQSQAQNLSQAQNQGQALNHSQGQAQNQSQNRTQNQKENLCPYQEVPEILTLAGTKSLISAYAVMNNGELKIGEPACTAAGARKRKIRFKSRFLTDPGAAGDIKSFAAGVLGELYGNGDLIRNEDSCFYIGCPAGWNRNDRERYREIFEKVGYPPAKIVSESRAALVAACQSRHLQVGYDILAKPVLVVDIGSSTTDFAYVCGGKEVDIQTAGEVRLGGGIMDEILLEECLKDSADCESIHRIFAESEPWKNYCEFAARRLKERYYSDEEYWKDRLCTASVMIRYESPIRLTLTMDGKKADLLVNKKVPALGNHSFRQVFTDSLENVKKQISGELPDLVFLTGGVSALPAIRTWCEEAFPESVIILGSEPEFSVARGLGWCGRIDEELRAFRQELEELKQSSTVEDLVALNINYLYMSAVDALVEPVIREAALPVLEEWRKGHISCLAEADDRMQTAIEAYLHSDRAHELLVKPISDWLRTISDRLEEYTVPICLKHGVPYSAMSLKSWMDTSDMEIRIETGKLFGVKELTFLIDSIISVLIGLLCGGSGIALVASGLPGILIGFAASFLVLAMGKKQMEKMLLNLEIPVPMRKLFPRNLIEARMDSIIGKVKSNLYNTLENDKNEAITGRMSEEISGQIEQCLTKMAEVVEIPLGV